MARMCAKIFFDLLFHNVVQGREERGCRYWVIWRYKKGHVTPCYFEFHSNKVFVSNTGKVDWLLTFPDSTITL